MALTYYAALPFVRDEHGMLRPDEGIECQSPAAAASRARALTATKAAGAVAFSGSGDPAMGDWADAVVIGRWGDTPPDLEIATGRELLPV